MVQLTDLPEDIFDIIFSFLPPQSLLSLCKTSRGFYQYRQDPAYWRTLTSNTFRLPISPLLKADGARWYWLYKRLRTQTRLYTWGQGVRSNLGPGLALPGRGPMGRRIRGFHPGTRRAFPRTGSTWPTETQVPEEISVIADLQCGGWSTTILSSEGKLYVVGAVDSMSDVYATETADHFTQLQSQHLTESNSAIKQFSSGRRHILALTDDGEILSWSRLTANGPKVYSRNGRSFGGKPTRVVAGWGESSAYIPETGIVYWIPITNGSPGEVLESFHAQEIVIPGTAQKLSANESVEVIAHIVLEGFIVWLTSDSNVYGCDIHVDDTASLEPKFPPFEVPGYSSSTRKLQDIQGQFNKFALFTESGEVLAGNTDYLRRCANKARNHPPLDPETTSLASTWSDLENLTSSRPRDVPALQNAHVIGLAFGDHHYLALHANGRITSYGTDCMSCGSLGLGDLVSGGRFRGLQQNQGMGSDTVLLPAAERSGRQVWFEPEKRDWLRWMQDNIHESNIHLARRDGQSDIEWSNNDATRTFLWSEWVEQEGRHWDEGPVFETENTGAEGDTTKTSTSKPNDSSTHLPQDDFQLDPYFAIGIAAAGWHSGGLVVVDEEKAHEIREKWIARISPDQEDAAKIMPGHFESGPTEPDEVYVWKLHDFPRIQLPDGQEMGGPGKTSKWRDGMPTSST